MPIKKFWNSTQSLEKQKNNMQNINLQRPRFKSILHVSVRIGAIKQKNPLNKYVMFRNLRRSEYQH